MRYKFKSKSFHKSKILSKIIYLTIILIVMLTFFLIRFFIKNTNNVLVNIASAEINKVTYSFITDKINNKVLNKDTLDDILIINKNKNDEILYVDFNIDKAYEILDNISDILTSSFKSLEDGNIDVAYLDKNLTHKTNNVVLSIPIGSSLSNMYFSNVGPKVPVKINFVGSVLTNLETKVTNYGLNNALVEVFVYIEFHNEIITPFNMKDLSFKYNAIIASKMIQGSVPSIYGGVLEKQSNVYTEKVD